MINKNKEDNASTWNANGMMSLPDCMKSNKGTITGSEWLLLTSKNIPNETPNDAKIANEPIIPASALGILFHNNPLIRKPIKGNKGTKYTNCDISIKISLYTMFE
jgi:hypothetical protein